MGSDRCNTCYRINHRNEDRGGEHRWTSRRISTKADWDATRKANFTGPRTRRCASHKKRGTTAKSIADRLFYISAARSHTQTGNAPNRARRPRARDCGTTPRHWSLPHPAEAGLHNGNMQPSTRAIYLGRELKQKKLKRAMRRQTPRQGRKPKNPQTRLGATPGHPLAQIHAQ